MNVLFMTIGSFDSIDQHGIYPDLLREFRKHGHKVYVVCANERRNGKSTEIINEGNTWILRVRIGNITKINLVEKGISILSISTLFKIAINKYYKDVRFNLVLYPTPPITLASVVEYIKRRDNSRTYLLLKDIFPQNAVDIEMMKKGGIKGFLYRYFRKQEKRLYSISDRIGCMSQANVDYVLKHNPMVAARDRKSRKVSGYPIVEICPNSVEPIDLSISKEEKAKVRKQYGIPEDRTVFIYGGNLGKPQGIGFMLKCLHSQRKNRNVYFLIVGNGTEYECVQRYIDKYKPENIMLRQWLPKEEYDRVVAASDVGLIFLDHRFTIPNFPSRMLDYMQAKLPILAVTDSATDIGKIITKNGFGWWCVSEKVEGFSEHMSMIFKTNQWKFREKSYQYMKDNYSVNKSYHIIMDERR